ncbi:MAG: hypothetical protein SGJ10_07720 [Bacteroidota bacterium]|nr:hypothetical protein [Bacteroidota bacterium]
MNKYLLIIIISICFISVANAQSDYEMASTRLVFGLDAKVFIKKMGFVPGITARYSYTNKNEDENCFSASFFTTKKYKDPVHLQARAVGTTPQTIDTIVAYQASFFSLLYHYHYYIQETKYDDEYGFYLAGAVGITKMLYTHAYNIEENRYISSYSYRQPKATICLQAAYGVHYQFASNLRVIGEGGFYYFYDGQSSLHNEKPHYISLQITAGLAFGLGSKGNGF